MRRGIGVLGAVLVLTACSTIDQEDIDAEVPDPSAQWVAFDAPDASIVDDWVATFEDDTLSALVREAMAQNKTVGAAAGRLEAARALVTITNAGRLPTLDAGLDNTSTNALDAAGNRETTSVRSLGLSTIWEVDLWGRIGDQVKASRADFRASQADWDGALLSIAGAVATGWFNLTEARLQTELSEENLETQRRIRELTINRFETGVATARDVRLALSSVASAEASVAQFRQFEAEAVRSLEVLLGRYPSAELEASVRLPEPPELTGAGAPADILTRRPDVRAAEQRLQAAGFRVREARKALLPRLTLTGSASTSGSDISDLVDTDRLVANLIGGVTQPLFRGGALLADIRADKGRAVTALNTYAAAVLDGYLEAENALAGEVLLSEREIALREAAKQALAAEQLTEAEYRRGIATIFDLLNAQSTRINSQSALITAQARRLTNRVQFYLAVGGSFDTAAARERLRAYGGKDSR